MSFVKLDSGHWTLRPVVFPRFPVCAHASSDPLDSNHFFISLSLHFPGRKPINTFAFLDCGATDSFISDTFDRRHSLPLALRDEPTPVFTVDNRPLTSGLVTHDTITNLRVQAHSENIRLGVVSMPYPVILGLDWLRKHNPAVDWAHGQLSLSCCGTNFTLVSATGAGHRLARLASSPLILHSTTSFAGLGLRLDCRAAVPFPSPSAPTDTPTRKVLPAANSPASPLPNHRGKICAVFNSFLLSPPRPKLDISFISPTRFQKYARSEKAAAIWYSPNQFIDSARLAALSLGDNPVPARLPEPPPDDSLPSHLSERDLVAYKLVPEKYRRFFDVFSPTEVDQLPPHRPYDVAIELEEGKSPPFGPIYSLSQEERTELFSYIESHLKKGFIRRSTSPAASPILFIWRKTGQLRLCVDYRALNAITRKNRYPIPLVNDLLDRVQGCKVFSVIDLKNAFNLIRVREGDEWKTAFRTHLGLFEYTVMPFGLTNAPATFQAYVQDTLRDILDVVCVVYLDDILIFSRTQEEHDHHCQMVLERLRKGRLFANIEKCEFDRAEVEYLGYILGAQGVKMNPKKLQTVMDWPLPSSIKDVQSFLGFSNFYRRFIKNYSHIVSPLHNLTKKTSTPFLFSLDAISAFKTLKSAFVSAPVLLHFNPHLPSTLITDASDFAISGIHLQPADDHILHPVSFFSHKLTPSEINYETHDKELLTIVESFRDMRAWLIGTETPISVCSDHKNLEYFMSSRVLNRRQARWSMFLSEFNFRLDYLPGIKNPADAPSHRPDYVPREGDEVLNLQRKSLLNQLHTERLFPSTPSCSDSPNPTPSSASALSTFSFDSSTLAEQFKEAFRADTEWRTAVTNGDESFSFQGDLVFHNNRLFVPAPLRSQVLHSRHDAVIAGHPGRACTTELVERDYSWPGARQFIRRYVEACNTCQRIKTPRHKPYGLLQPLEIPDRPWRSISMDFIVKLPASHGCDSIWVICDRFTRAAHFIPTVETLTAPDLALLFLNHVFKYHGLPESIVSDRGSVFVSQFWREVMRLIDVKLKPSTAYHPQTDGLTERTNQTLETYLRAYCSYQQDDWVDYLALAEFAFNNLVNSSTQQTPFFANLGFHPTFEPRITERSTVPAAANLAACLEIIHQELRTELAQANETQARYYNSRALPAPEYQPGDLVWLLRHNIKTTRPSDKLDYRKLGPFPIVARKGRSAYHLRLPHTLSRLHPVFNVSLLKPYRGPLDETTPACVVLDGNSTPEFALVLDSRKVGRRYEYLLSWKNLPVSENSWVPHSDLPSTLDELLERFHRRHPTLPRPHQVDISWDRSLPCSNQTASVHDPLAPTGDPVPSTPPSDSHTPFVPLHAPSPPQPLRAIGYAPPTKTTLRSGRVSRPLPPHLDPEIHTPCRARP